MLEVILQHDFFSFKKFISPIPFNSEGNVEMVENSTSSNSSIFKKMVTFRDLNIYRLSL